MLKLFRAWLTLVSGSACGLEAQGIGALELGGFEEFGLQFQRWGSGSSLGLGVRVFVYAWGLDFRVGGFGISRRSREGLWL